MALPSSATEAAQAVLPTAGVEKFRYERAEILHQALGRRYWGSVSPNWLKRAMEFRRSKGWYLLDEKGNLNPPARRQFPHGAEASPRTCPCTRSRPQRWRLSAWGTREPQAEKARDGRLDFVRTCYKYVEAPSGMSSFYFPAPKAPTPTNLTTSTTTKAHHIDLTL